MIVGLKEEACITLLVKCEFQETNFNILTNTTTYDDIHQEIILNTLEKFGSILVQKTCNRKDASRSCTESVQTRKRVISIYGKDRYDNIYKPFVKDL